MKLRRLVFALTLLAGCAQDPFPKDGKIQTEPPPDPKPVAPVFVLEPPEIMEFFEGQPGEYEIKASVPAPGQPVITINGLPEDATFDPATRKIHWTPGPDTANDPNNADVTSKQYPLQMTLTSSVDKLTSTRRSPVLLVKDVARKFDIVYSGAARVEEGETLRYKLQLKNEDFPNGKFEIQAKGLPHGAELEVDRSDPSLWYLIYTPSLTATTSGDDWDSWERRYKKEFEISLQAFGPRNQRVTRDLTLTVLDERQKPQITAPVEVQQGSDGQFTVQAADPNGETGPRIELVEQPSYGVVTVTQAGRSERTRANDNPFSSMVVRWDQVPVDKMGTSDKLKISACVYGRWRQYDVCSETEVKVTFTAQVHAAPVIDRSRWALGEIKYAKVGDSFSVRLPVNDGDGNGTAITVTVEPGTTPAEFEWDNDRLTLEPKTPGLRQFNVTATSAYGLARTESFLLQVMPGDWSPVLLLGKYLDSPEITKTAALLDKPGISLPGLLDEKVLALRRALVFGTEALAESRTLPAVEEAAVKMKVIVVSSPLLKNLKGKLADELQALGIQYAPRSSRPIDALTVEVVPDHGFAEPKKPLKLAGTLTSESARPLLLKAPGGDSSCETVLQLMEGGFGGPVAQVCRRADGGRVLVSGFELGDLVTEPADAGIAKQWLESLLKQERIQ